MGKMPEHHDQREFIRVPVHSDVTYKILSSGQAKKNQAKDVSQTGICFISEQNFEPGTVIDITISLEQSEFSFTAHGIVRWSKEIVKNRQYEIGIKFDNLPDVTTSKLISYIQAAKRLGSYS